MSFVLFSFRPQVVHGAFIEPAHRIRKRSINQQLRISLVYDNSVYRLDDDKFALVNVSVWDWPVARDASGSVAAYLYKLLVMDERQLWVSLSIVTISFNFFCSVGL